MRKSVLSVKVVCYREKCSTRLSVLLAYHARYRAQGKVGRFQASSSFNRSKFKTLVFFPCLLPRIQLCSSRRQPSQGNMTTPRYRFILFAFQEELAEQLASQTPVLGRASLYTYDFPESSDETRKAVKKQMVCKPKHIQASSLRALEAEEIKQWAEANQKVILTPAYAP